MKSDISNTTPNFSSKQADILATELIIAASNPDKMQLPDLISKHMSSAIDSGYFVEFFGAMIESLGVKLAAEQEKSNFAAVPTSELVPNAEFNQNLADALYDGDSDQAEQLIQAAFSQMATRNNYLEKFTEDPNFVGFRVPIFMLVILASLVAAYGTDSSTLSS